MSNEHELTAPPAPASEPSAATAIDKSAHLQGSPIDKSPDLQGSIESHATAADWRAALDETRRMSQNNSAAPTCDGCGKPLRPLFCGSCHRPSGVAPPAAPADDLDRMIELLRERDLGIAEFHAMQLRVADALAALRTENAQLTQDRRDFAARNTVLAKRAEDALARAERAERERDTLRAALRELVAARDAICERSTLAEYNAKEDRLNVAWIEARVLAAGDAP